MKFKVGDKVKCTNIPWISTSKSILVVGTVVEIDGNILYVRDDKETWRMPLSDWWVRKEQ